MIDKKNNNIFHFMSKNMKLFNTLYNVYMRYPRKLAIWRFAPMYEVSNKILNSASLIALGREHYASSGLTSVHFLVKFELVWIYGNT